MADLLLTQSYGRITVTLTADEREALRTLAFRERRDTRQQAALLIRQQLEKEGLLLAVERPAQAEGAGQ